MGRIFDEQGQRKEEYTRIPQPSVAPKLEQPQLSPYQRFVSGKAIPAIGALLGFGGGMLAGGPAGAALGTAGVGGGARVLQDILKLKAGLPQTPPEQFVKEEPIKFAERYVGGAAGGQILKALPGLLGTLPVIGPKIQQARLEKAGKGIEKYTRYHAGEYPAGDLQQQFDEATRKYDVEPKLRKLKVEQAKQISKFTNPQGFVPQERIQDLKTIAYQKSYEKTAPKWQQSFWKSVGDVYKNVTLEVEPLLKQPLEAYGAAKKGLETTGQFKKLLGRRAAWTGTGALFYEMLRRLRALGKEKETRGR